MFDLTPADLAGRILDCGGGPSSFTAKMHRQGRRTISCDPLYQFTASEIQLRIAETSPRMLALNEANRDNFVWDEYGSPAQLGEIRMRAMGLFLEDYEAGKSEGRYQIGALPELPFAPGSFGLALCSHLLFTYSELFTTEFHLQGVLEMLRVANQVRLFPLLTSFTGEVSPHLAPVMDHLQSRGYQAEIRQVGYEFQKGGNQMLCIDAG